MEKDKACKHKVSSYSIVLRCHPPVQRYLVRFQPPSHTGVIDYDKVCFIHDTPQVAHNLTKGVDVTEKDFRFVLELIRVEDKGRNIGLSFSTIDASILLPRDDVQDQPTEHEMSGYKKKQKNRKE